MYLQQADSSPEPDFTPSNGSVEALVEAYQRSMRRHLALQGSLMRSLDEREREARQSMDAAQKELEYVLNTRRALLNDSSTPTEPPPAARSFVSNGMEATTWRWFHENTKEEDRPRPSPPDSIVSQIPLGFPGGERESMLSEGTVQERPFNYLAMKYEGSEGGRSLPSASYTSKGNDDLNSSIDLASSVDSLTNSMRSTVKHSSMNLPASFSLPMARHLSPLVMVKRESLAILLNAFDRILLNGTI